MKAREQQLMEFKMRLDSNNNTISELSNVIAHLASVRYILE